MLLNETGTEILAEDDSWFLTEQTLVDPIINSAHCVC